MSESDNSEVLQPERIQRARQRMQQRNPAGCLNSSLSGSALGRIGHLSTQAVECWEQIVSQRQLSARSGLRLLRVARTLADLEDNDAVGKGHLAEALCFRSFDQLIKT